MLLKKTVYIREEDLELWESCPNKSLMVHNALRTDWDKEILLTVPAITVKNYTRTEKRNVLGEPLVTVKTTKDLADLTFGKKVKGDRCPHGFNLKVSKCRYGCKN